VKKFPSLLFFKDEKLVGKIDGYYDKSNKNELMKKIKSITQAYS